MRDKEAPTSAYKEIGGKSTRDPRKQAVLIGFGPNVLITNKERGPTAITPLLRYRVSLYPIKLCLSGMAGYCARLPHLPCPSFPFFFGIPCFFFFFRCEELLVFLCDFPFFSRDFRGSVGINNPCFVSGFPCIFPQKQGRKDRVGYRKLMLRTEALMQAAQQKRQ